MRSWLKHLFSFLVVVGLVGIIILLSGVINIAASSGHFKVTALLLEFAKRRYASTYSLFVKKPDLPTEGIVMRGAGHYEIGCRQCHGIPGEVNLLGLMTTPESPYLPPTIKKYNEKELFRIVKHGIKFTGMPAWPDLHRDDEVWAMVSFLNELPEMSQEEYKELVYGETGPVILPPPPYTNEILSDTLKTCAHCHGIDGNGRGEEAFPKLSSQNNEYLYNSLKAYKSGNRNSGTMELIAASLSDEMIQSVSEYYSKQKRKNTISPRPRISTSEKESAIRRGKKIAQEGIPEQKVAACVGCHGPTSQGGTTKPFYPDLRGQPSSYLSNQIRLFLEDKRGGTEFANIMKKAVTDLNEGQRRDVALYYESLLHPGIDEKATDIEEKNEN